MQEDIVVKIIRALFPSPSLTLFKVYFQFTLVITVKISSNCIFWLKFHCLSCILVIVLYVTFAPRMVSSSCIVNTCN